MPKSYFISVVMTPDEALSVCTVAYPPNDDWAALRARRREAQQVLALLTGDELRAVLPRVLQISEAQNDTHVEAMLAVPLARATLELNEPTGFVARLARVGHWQPYTAALKELSVRGSDTWPLVTEVTSNPTVESITRHRVLAEFLEFNAAGPSRFDEVLSADPGPALSAAWGSSFSGKPLQSLLPAIARFTLQSTSDELRISALRLLEHAPELDASQFEVLLPQASAPLAAALASFFVKRGVTANFLDDARTEVRRAAFEAFILRQPLPSSAVPRVIAAWNDPEPRIRSSAERVLREFTEKNGLTPSELRLLERDREDVAVFLAWAAVQHAPMRDWCLQHASPESRLFTALSAPYSLQCAACRTLGTSQSWSYEGGEPKGLEALQRVCDFETPDWDSSSLMRCKTCFAHYTYLYDLEVDVTAHQSWSLTRLRLAELRSGEHAAKVDFDDQHFAHWLQAAESDSQHLDPKVRELANWELSAPPAG